MAEKENKKVVGAIASNSERVRKLRYPVTFDGKEITEIDLSGLENLNGRDLKEVDRLFRMTGGAGVQVKELNSTYLLMVASRATGYPLELFEELNFKDASMIEVIVKNFIILWD